MADPQKIPVFGSPATFKGLLFGVGVIIAQLALNATFYFAIADLPRGTEGRPMAHTFWFGVFAFAGLVVGVPLCLADARAAAVAGNRFRRFCAYAGLVLNLAAYPIAEYVFAVIARSRGFIFAM